MRSFNDLSTSSTRRNNPKVSSAAAVNYLMRIKPTGESGEIVTLNIDDATTGRSFMGVFRAAALAGILAFAAYAFVLIRFQTSFARQTRRRRTHSQGSHWSSKASAIYS